METIFVPYQKKVKVTVPEAAESSLSINGVSISCENDIPAKGRVVLYLQPIENDKVGKEIAVAPLTIGKVESRKLEFLFYPGNQFILSTKGDNVDVTVHAYMQEFEHPVIETLE